MGDLDDMNATPLGKLPMPAVQSKNDGPKVDMATSYADILKEMNTKPKAEFPAAAAATAHQYQQQFLPPMRNEQQAQTYAEVFDEPVPHTYARQRQRPQPQPQPQRLLVRHRQPVRQVAGGGGGGGGLTAAGGWVAKARLYKSSIIVAAVVWVVLTYVAPKLAQFVPRLLTPMGKFNAVGLLVLASMCGGIHRVADIYVK